jgi:hypothetical protein
LPQLVKPRPGHTAKAHGAVHEFSEVSLRLHWREHSHAAAAHINFQHPPALRFAIRSSHQTHDLDPLAVFVPRHQVGKGNPLGRRQICPAEHIHSRGLDQWRVVARIRNAFHRHNIARGQ